MTSIRRMRVTCLGRMIQLKEDDSSSGSYIIKDVALCMVLLFIVEVVSGTVLFITLR